MVGNIEVVNMIINSHNYEHYEYGLKGACRGGHLEIINMMLSKGATNYNWGLEGACLGGHLELVKMMLDLGANNYNKGLDNACLGGNIAIVNLMINLGANNIDESLNSAWVGGHFEIFKLLLYKGATRFESLYDGDIGFKVLYSRVTKKVLDLPIKSKHLEYHLLNFYRYKIQDIDRIINKYLY